MSFIKFEEDFRSRGHDPVTELCWQAREVLGAYMLERVGIVIEGALRPDDYDEEDLEDDEDLEPVLHETTPIYINPTQQAFLSNRPFLLDDVGHIYEHTSPGFVALHIEKIDLVYASVPPSLDGCDQVIFKLPHDMTEEAAIYHGFSIYDEDSRIDHLSAEVNELKNIVAAIGRRTLDLMVNDQGFWEVTYLAQTPEPSLELLLNGLEQSD